jgi:predicted RNase H-like HicB family nuclease
MVEITVEYHEEDGLWWAESDQVPGWAAGGSSQDEVRARVREGLRFFLNDDVVVIVEARHAEGGFEARDAGYGAPA